MVKYLDRVRIGQNTDGVVSSVYDENNIEFVYIDHSSKKNIYEDAVLIDGEWKFKEEGVAGGYADGKDRLAEAVQKLNRSWEQRLRLER
jgi:hypothetical protein